MLDVEVVSMDGYLREDWPGARYLIRRFRADRGVGHREVIERGLTRPEAAEYVRRLDTRERDAAGRIVWWASFERDVSR